MERVKKLTYKVLLNYLNAINHNQVCFNWTPITASPLLYQWQKLKSTFYYVHVKSGTDFDESFLSGDDESEFDFWTSSEDVSIMPFAWVSMLHSSADSKQQRFLGLRGTGEFLN